MESNKKLNVLVQTFKTDLDELDKRFNKKKETLVNLPLRDPSLSNVSSTKVPQKPPDV